MQNVNKMEMMSTDLVVRDLMVWWLGLKQYSQLNVEKFISKR